MTVTATDYKACVEDIEQAYEFMLAYAAQGRDEEAREGMPIRPQLERLADGLQRLPGLAGTEADRMGEEGAAFVALLDADAGRAATAVSLALATPNISSQLVDNLNASVHVRTLLTDLFLFDEAVKVFRRG